MKEFTWDEGVAGWKFELQVAKWVAKGCMSWSHQGGDCKGNCRRDLLLGVVQRQAIMVVYGLPGLVGKRSIKCL